MFLRNLKLFSIGMTGYSLIEILWRGRTHWTMSLLGGGCFVTLYQFYKRHTAMKLINKCLCGSFIITTAELLCGLIVNCKLKMRVWDYTNMKFNWRGQICATYSLLWGLLCIPVSKLCGFIFKREKELTDATKIS